MFTKESEIADMECIVSLPNKLAESLYLELKKSSDRAFVGCIIDIENESSASVKVELLKGQIIRAEFVANGFTNRKSCHIFINGEKTEIIAREIESINQEFIDEITKSIIRHILYLKNGRKHLVYAKKRHS